MFLKIVDFETTENDSKNVDQMFYGFTMNGQRKNVFVVIRGFRS